MCSSRSVRNRLFRGIVGVALFALLWYGIARHQPQPQLPTMILQLADQQLIVERATTPEQQSHGLMFRRELARDHGMLFVFAVAQPLSFWMKNTEIPLSIAFLDDAGRVQSMTDMQPHDQTWHQSPRPARYALEVNQGWFTANNIRVGDALPVSTQ